MTRSLADSPSLGEGRQYHIGLKNGEVADFIFLCGDPDRAQKVAKHFDHVELKVQNREYVTITGTQNGRRISVMGTGIGPDNTEIAVIELSQIVKNPTFIRIGSTGSIQKDIGIGELVISTAAVRLENTSTFYVPDGYPAVAHYEVVSALVASAKQLKAQYHTGITATVSSFYGGQDRQVPGFKSRFPDLLENLSSTHVLNLEMEASCLLTLSAMRGFRAGVICAVFANRPNNEFISASEKALAEENAIKTALGALDYL
ncbi:MAG: nucleoside phosphorylase [Myxococcaceae bacterium]